MCSPNVIWFFPLPWVYGKYTSQALSVMWRQLMDPGLWNVKANNMCQFWTDTVRNPCRIFFWSVSSLPWRIWRPHVEMEQPQDQSHLDGWVAVWRRMAWSHWRLCISFVKQLRLLGCSLHSISPAYSSWYWKDVVGMLTYSPVSVSVSSLVITWAISKSLLKKNCFLKISIDFIETSLVLHALIHVWFYAVLFLSHVQICVVIVTVQIQNQSISRIPHAILPQPQSSSFLPYSSLTIGNH